MNIDTDDGHEDDQRLRPLVMLVLGMVLIGSALDLYLDGPDDWRSWHLWLEVALMVIAATTGVMLFRAWRRAARSLLATERSLSAIEADRQAWQRRAEHALHGLGRAINEQFDAWQLTPAERDVALLLLQGLGHKQIAFRTNRSESTVRQHAVAIYGKSGQGGRAELAAFFLGGLMLPAPATPDGVSVG